MKNNYLNDKTTLDFSFFYCFPVYFKFLKVSELYYYFKKENNI